MLLDQGSVFKPAGQIVLPNGIVGEQQEQIPAAEQDLRLANLRIVGKACAVAETGHLLVPENVDLPVPVGTVDHGGVDLRREGGAGTADAVMEDPVVAHLEGAQRSEGSLAVGNLRGL